MELKHYFHKLFGNGSPSSQTADTYHGAAARSYDAIRESSPKWAFEQDSLHGYLQDIAPEIASVLDAPVGTGRFLESYLSMPSLTTIHGFDLSQDMLQIARARANTPRIRLIQHDVVRHPLPVTGDLVVSFRFLNLLAPIDAAQALAHLLGAANKYAVISCRLVGPQYRGETYVENKIHLHAESDWQILISRHGFVVAEQRTFIDERPGTYHIILLRRGNPAGK